MARLSARVLATLLTLTLWPVHAAERELTPLERAARQRDQEKSTQPPPVAKGREPTPLERAARQRDTGQGSGAGSTEVAAGPPQTWRVGPEQALKRPSDAARTARTGDTVEIDAGTYEGDVAVWPQHRLTIRGVGQGRAVLKAHGQAAQGKAIWVVRGNDVRIENIEFADTKVRDKNGAGIRHEGGNMTIVDCVFRDNENGILSGVTKDGEIRVERSEFARNGHTNGQAHGIYIGQIGRLTLIGNYFHETPIGHLVKSRAKLSVIAYNRIMDQAKGRASYAIDLPDGGIAYVVGNVIQQGQQAENWGIIAYMMENRHPKNELYVVNNTIVNELGKGTFVNVRAGRAIVANNIMIGGGTALEGVGELVNNLLAEFRGDAPRMRDRGLNETPNRGNRVVKDARLRDLAGYDYRLAGESPAVGAALDPGEWLGGKAPLKLESQIAPPRGVRKRRAGAPFDMGAFAAE